MTPRYVVMSVAEARASGKMAAGFDDLSNAHWCACALNEEEDRPDEYQWAIQADAVAAIVDTATAADGSPGAAEWSDPGPLVIRDLIELHADHSEWRVCNVYGDNHAEGECKGLGANRRAAESAAAALLVDALLALGETGREAMRKAGEGRK